MADSLKDTIDEIVRDADAKGLVLSVEPTDETFHGEEALEILFGGWCDWVRDAIPKE